MGTIQRYLEKGRYLLVVDENLNISNDDEVIAVMGGTGTGKSSFIKQVTGADIEIGHELTSATKHISVFSRPHPDGSKRSLVLVDTPGFDDTFCDDAEILETIATWLAATYHRHVTLTGILFFHRIVDNRIQGSSLKNLKLFRKLVGEDSLRNVVLVQTHWDVIEESLGVRREQDLRSHETFWKPMIARGAQTVRYYNTADSANQALNVIHGKPRAITRVQTELVDKHLRLLETDAGAAVDAGLAQWAQDNKKLLDDLDVQEKSISGRDTPERRKKIRVDRRKAMEAVQRAEQQRKLLAHRPLWRRVGRRILRALSFA